jgi:hypothetical protein
MASPVLLSSPSHLFKALQGAAAFASSVDATSSWFLADKHGAPRSQSHGRDVMRYLMGYYIYIIMIFFHVYIYKYIYVCIYNV